MANPRFSIAAPDDTRQCIEDLKQAVESLHGQGQAAKPYLYRAMTAQDLITLGLVTEAEIMALERSNR